MSMPTRVVLSVAAVLLAIAGAVVVVRVNSERDRAAVPEDVPRSTRTGRPNVLVIMTDDQTLEAMRVLDNVDTYLTDAGTTFTNYFVTFPTCCPSRTTYLTGQYAHNHGVEENVAPKGGFHKANQDEYLPVWLQRAGYWTASIGKYLNQWGADGHIEAPKGWNRWFGLIDPTTYRYFGYDVSIDGVRHSFGEEPQDYQTDVLGAEVVRVIRDRATAPEPWFVSWTPLAPHAIEPEGPAGRNAGDRVGGSDAGPGGAIAQRIRSTLPVPSPEFRGKMARQEPPRTASYNQADVTGIPEGVRRVRITPNLQSLIREGYQRELETLQSVDKWVKRIIQMLTRTDQLDNTVVIFTSDNGYFHGEHRLSFSKVQLYEAAVRLPLVIRGPGFPRAGRVDALTANIDLTPTILAVAGARATLPVDGRDLGALVQDPAQGAGRGVLLENWSENSRRHVEGIRTDRYKYLVTDGRERELYDLVQDPDEVDNRADEPSYAPVGGELADRLERLGSCAGATCEGWTAPPH